MSGEGISACLGDSIPSQPLQMSEPACQRFVSFTRDKRGPSEGLSARAIIGAVARNLAAGDPIDHCFFL